MPPHCDSLDGPVVTAARQALENNDVNLILPYVPEQDEAEVIRAFKKVQPLHQEPNGAREIADMYFFETVVRLHRAGEGAAFSGLKPAGLDVGPVIPVAERAIETSSPDDLIEILVRTLEAELKERFGHMLHAREHAGESVGKARSYVEAMLGLQVWSHDIYMTLKSAPHEGHHDHG